MRYFFIFFLFSILNGQSILPSLHSWFSAIELSTAGGGSLIMSPTSRINNPANSIFKKSFSTSLILYPAEIQAQSLALTYPLEKKIIVVGINHISYGAFQGYDENATPTNNYNSNDTWIKLGYTTKPGVKNITISEKAAAFNLFYAPDPSSQIACSIGGNVAENSGGVHCLKYGLTLNNIFRLRAVNFEGEIFEVGLESFGNLELKE